MRRWEVGVIGLLDVKMAILAVIMPGSEKSLGDLVLAVTENLSWVRPAVLEIGLLMDEALSALEAEGAVSVSRGVVGTFVSRAGI